jgi:L-2-hydroxycarboxylate dehydrogenase (NAD+)
MAKIFNYKTLTAPKSLLYSIEDLTSFSIACLKKVGARQSDAREVSGVLAMADLKGKDSHGIARLRRYVDGLAQGKINAQATPKIIKESSGSILIDAQNGLGQPASIFAMSHAIEKAKKGGIGIATVLNSNHFGIAGYYADLACQKNMVGIAVSNASPQVAPTFGAESMYGTNPLAIGFPINPQHSFLLDMATSIVSRGRLERYRWQSKDIPEGWIIDQTGENPESLSEIISNLKKRIRYSLLPLGGFGETTGGHKGYGLGVAIDLLCGPFIGAGWGRHVYGPKGANLGHCFISIDPEFFAGLPYFQIEAQKMLSELQSSKKIKTAEKIYFPGEKSSDIAKLRKEKGIPLPLMVVDDLKKLSLTYDVPLSCEATYA